MFDPFIRTSLSPRRGGTAHVLLAAAALALSPTTGAQEVAWAWVKPAGQGATFTPFSAWQYSTAGQTITVQRGSGNHEFIVQMPGVAPSLGGSIHATAHNGNHTAVVRSWNSLGGNVLANIVLFDSSGQPANDAAFIVHWRHSGPNERREAYTWANLPTSPSYTPHPSYSWNGNRGAPTITRTAVGTYAVRFPGLSPQGAELGHVQVSPHGTLPVRAKVASWGADTGDMVVQVRCFDFAGAPTDARFVCSYNEKAAPIDPDQGSGAHLLTSQPTATLSSPIASVSDSNGRYGPKDAETIERLTVGRYRVNLPDVAPNQSSTVQVTAYGTGTEYASVDQWVSDGCGGTDVVVETWDTTGAPADARFTLRYLTNRPASTPVVAWARVDPYGQGASWSPPAFDQYSTAGQPITVTRGALPSQFTVTIPGATPQPGGCVHVTAHGGNHTAVVTNWSWAGGDADVYIELYEPNGAPAPNRQFTLHWRLGGNPAAREAYCLALDPTNPSYQPSLTAAWNGNRPRPTVTRTGTGSYQVAFPDLAPTGYERGSVQVTPFGQGMTRAKVVSWGASGPDLHVDVRCTDKFGNAKDAKFQVSYNEIAAPIAEEVGSGAHVWANLPTLANYTPHARFTDSNGIEGPAESETIERFDVGRYRVNLPNLRGVNVMAQVTAHGPDASYATTEYFGWLGPHGTNAMVETWDASGNPIDARFTLLFLSDEPAVATATNEGTGGGCHGPALFARTRPLLCRDWQFALSVPLSAALGFLQFGLTNPNQSLNPTAPGCTAVTDGAVSVLFVPPIPSPSYALSIPGDPSFLGLPIYAQGGAFIPGVNPWSLALTNGIRGKVGDY